MLVEEIVFLIIVALFIGGRIIKEIASGNWLESRSSTWTSKALWG
jgi:hypothetical protein